MRRILQKPSRTTFAVVFLGGMEMCLLEAYVLVIHNCSPLLKDGFSLLPQTLQIGCFYLCTRQDGGEELSTFLYLSGQGVYLAECLLRA